MQRESQRVQRVLGEGSESVEEGPERVSRGSRESQETVQRESGERPEFQERVKRDSGEGLDIVRRGSGLIQKRVQRES